MRKAIFSFGPGSDKTRSAASRTTDSTSSLTPYYVSRTNYTPMLLQCTHLPHGAQSLLSCLLLEFAHLCGRDT